MSQTIAQPAVFTKKSKVSSRSKFFSFCENQKDYRFLWMGIILFGQIGAIVPVTAISIAFFGNNELFLWMLMFFFNVPVFVLNLAAQPLKITIPALIFAAAGSLSLVVASFAIYFM